MRAVLWLLSPFIGWRMVVGGGTDDKITGGGILMDISQTPYMVSIHLDEPNPVAANVLWHPICAGAIFAAAYVITACHCVVGLDAAGQVYPLVAAYPLEKWAFLAGAWDLHIPDYLLNNATQRRTPASIRYHPKCHPERTPWLLNNVPVYDMAVAKMTVPFDVNRHVKPAAIYSFDKVQFKKSLDAVISDKIHTRCVVAGWGSTWDIPIVDSLNVTLSTTNPKDNCSANDFPDEDLYKLKYNRMQPRYEVDCLNALVAAIKKNVGENVIRWPEFEATFREKLKDQICGLNKNSSPCRGDSGTGLVCDDHFIIGIDSFGVGCGSDAPDVFQSVLQVLDWLEEEVCSVQTCTDVYYLHSGCRIQGQEELAIIEKCQTTTPSPPKNRDATDTGIPSSVAPIVKTKWLMMILSAVTY